MALLIDGQVTSVEDIVRIDSGAVEVSRSEGINLDSKCLLAHRDCRLKVSQFIVNNGLETKLGTNNNVLRMDRIVTTDGLRNWLAFHTLELFYSDAYYRSLNDRYGKKYEHFGELTRRAWDIVVDTGIACTYDPVGRGSLRAVEVNQAAISPGTYHVALAWVSSSGNTGCLSEVYSITVESGEGFTVVPGIPYENAIGYILYAGRSADALWLQIGGPIQPTVAYIATNIVEGIGQPIMPEDRIDFVLRKSRSFTRG